MDVSFVDTDVSDEWTVKVFARQELPLTREQCCVCAGAHNGVKIGDPFEVEINDEETIQENPII